MSLSTWTNLHYTGYSLTLSRHTHHAVLDQPIALFRFSLSQETTYPLPLQVVEINVISLNCISLVELQYMYTYYIYETGGGAQINDMHMIGVPTYLM